jgi:GT2 family glycosyltransferase
MRWLGPALDSLQRSSGQEEIFTLSLFYVDNNSSDGSVPFVRERYPTVHVVQNRANRGFSAANNQAMRIALDSGTDYVFLVNPDTYSPAGLIRHLTTFMQERRSYGIVGPLQWQYTLGEPLEPVHNEWTRGAIAAGERHVLAVNRGCLAPPPDPGTPRAPQTLEHGYVQGAALFARAEMLRQIGLLDEVYHSFYEETELCRRARLAGWRVALVTDCGIHHRGGNGTTSSYRRLLMMRNKYFFLLTDTDLTVADMIAIIRGWLGRDLSGNGVGGASTLGQAWLDAARSCAWLVSRLPTVIHRRRSLSSLRSADRDLNCRV